MTRRRRVDDEGLLPDEAACEVCGGLDSPRGNRIVACEGCNGNFHQRCIGLRSVPKGDWFCSDCALAPEVVGELQAATFWAARPPRLPKRARREDAGLGEGGFPTLEEAERLQRAALAPSSQDKVGSLRRRWVELVEATGVSPNSPEAVELFATWRVKNGLAVDTILCELSNLRYIEGVQLPAEPRFSRIKMAVRRLAECPGAAKAPILPSEVAAIRRIVLSGWTRDSGHPRDRRKLRNWTFLYLAFVGLFRGSELLNLRWQHVEIVEEGVYTYGLAEERSGRPAEPSGVRIHIVESKTDPGAVGQVIPLSSGAPHDPLGCPARLLIQLRRGARGPFVFEDTRPGKKTGTPLSQDTLRNAFKDALNKAGVPEERLEQLGLHSFRRGGATEALAKGASVQEIKTLGRWKSNTVNIYALIADKVAAKVSDKLIKSLLNLEGKL